MSSLNPPKEEQIRQYLEADPVSTNPWSSEPSLDVVMACLQSIDARLKALEQPADAPPADEPVPPEADQVNPMQE